MTDAIAAVVRSGLHEENLVRLASLCRERLPRKPSLYGPLILICKRLITEYDGQGIAVTLPEGVHSLQEPILALLAAESETSELFVARLDELFTVLYRVLARLSQS